jgi:hypothetical protein
MLFDDVEIAFRRGLDSRHKFLRLRRDADDSISQSPNDCFWREAAVRRKAVDGPENVSKLELVGCCTGISAGL